MKAIKLIIVGVGPGDPDLVTAGALKAISGADLVLVPCSGKERASVAERIISAHLPNVRTTPLLFPMVSDAEARDGALREQLEEIRGKWRDASCVVLPVIGDSALYATGAYLFDVWRELVPDLELELIPGISAHSFAASRIGAFLAMGSEVMTIVPGTAERAAIVSALKSANVAALYKPSALRGDLRDLVESAGPWKKMMRIDRAGLEEETILTGTDALAAVREYLSVLLLWR